MNPQRLEITTPRGPFSSLHWPSDGGGLPLIFSHANGYNASTYKRFFQPLAGQNPIYAIDARGHGFTTADADPPQLTSWQVYVDDLLAIVNALGGRAHLAGHSIGAVVSMRVAAAAPEAIETLTLLEPVLPPPLACRALAVLRAVGLHRRAPIVANARRRRARWPSIDAAAKAYEGRGGFATWPAPWVRDYLEGGCRTLPTGEVALTCDPAWESESFHRTAYDSWRYIPAVQAPMSVVYGGRSTTFFSRSAKAMRRRKPDAKLLCVPEATHFLPMETPDIARDALRAQLTRSAISA